MVGRRRIPTEPEAPVHFHAPISLYERYQELLRKEKITMREDLVGHIRQRLDEAGDA